MGRKGNKTIQDCDYDLSIVLTRCVPNRQKPLDDENQTFKKTSERS